MMFKITKFFNLLILYNLKIMDFTFKTLSEIVGPNQTINDLKIEKIIDVYLKNLVDQFQAGDKSYKSNKDIEIKNYKKFYEELTKYDKELFTDWDCINLKDQDFLIKEIEDIRSVEEVVTSINVIYDHKNPNDCYFKYDDNQIDDGDNESFTGLYKKNSLYKINYLKRCVFGPLYSRIKKNNRGAGVADDKYEKSYEYLDLSGYLLYDYVHNYLKYAGNPICNHLNKFLEEQILNILNIDNSLIPDIIDDLTTFTLYDIIYPNAHYIYNVKDKNFCLPIDRIICHFDENPENIGTKESLKYEKKLTIANFMQDIFGMSKNSIHKDIQDIFINCLNKKLFNLFTDVKDNNIFYNKKLTLIFPDIIALFAFFIKLNDEIRKKENGKKKDNEDILNIEIYKSVNLIKTPKIAKNEILYYDLPFLYTDDGLRAASARNEGNADALDFIDRGTHKINTNRHRDEVMTDDFCSQCFQKISSYVYENNFILDVKKDELYKFIFDSMLRIGRYGSYLILRNNFTGMYATMRADKYTTEKIIGFNDEIHEYGQDFYNFCVKNGTKDPEARKNSEYVFSNYTNIMDTVNTIIVQFSDSNFYSGVLGLLILQTIYLNSVMSDATYNIVFQLYNIGIKTAFAQHYIWKHLMTRDKNEVIKNMSNDNLINFNAKIGGIMDLDDILSQLFKSIYLDTDGYPPMIFDHIKNFVLNYDDIYIYDPQNNFDTLKKKKYIFTVLLDYYNQHTHKKIIDFKSKELKVHKKKYRNIEILQMIKKLTQTKLKFYFENNNKLMNVPKEEKELTDKQKNDMLEIVGTVVKKIKPETDKIKDTFNIYGELKDFDKKQKDDNTDNNDYRELLNDNNARYLFKGGQPVDKNINYNVNDDVYSLLLLNYYDKLTVQKLKYYYLFNFLLYSNYLLINIVDNSSYMNDNDKNGLFVLFWPNYHNINLFMTKELTDSASNLLKNISYLIRYYFYGINYQFLKNKEHIINIYYENSSAHGQLFINNEAIRKSSGNMLDPNNELFKFDIIKKTFDEINDQLPGDIKIKENNNSKQNINNQGQTIMQTNSNGIYSMTQMPEITKQNLTEGNNINVSFLNNNGLLPFLLSRNLNKEILKGGDSLFNRAASAFGQIRHMTISDIINLYRKGGNNILNVEQMTFLKNAERLDKEREEEYNLIIGVINYIRDAIKRENIPEKDLKTFDKERDDMGKTGFKADKTIQLHNMHVQKGGKDIPDILTKLKQGQYRRQQIDNNYIEELNNYLKSF